MNEDYKTVCDKCGIKTWYEKKQLCHNTIWEGCKTCGSHEFVDKQSKCTGTLRLVDNSLLDERLTSYFKNEERVEVVYKEGKVRITKRFWVGKSTGWKPIYLEIKNLNSSGGAGAYIPKGAEVRGTGIYK